MYSDKPVHKPFQICKAIEQEKHTLKTKVHDTSDTSLTGALNGKLDPEVTLFKVIQKTWIALLKNIVQCSYLRLFWFFSEVKKVTVLLSSMIGRQANHIALHMHTCHAAVLTATL